MGHLFLLCGPPGAGKTSLLKKIYGRGIPIEQLQRLSTRLQRKEEGDEGNASLEYKFLSPGNFAERLARGNIANLIEWNGNYYATQTSVLTDSFKGNHNSVLLEDIPSSIALKEKYKSGVTVIFMFTGNRNDLLHDIDFGSYVDSHNQYLAEWRRRLGLKFDSSAKIRNTQPDAVERYAYIENQLKRAIPDIAFIIGKIREDDEIRVLANRKNDIDEISDETVDEFVAIINEPRIEVKRKVDTCSKGEITDPIKDDPAKWTVRYIVGLMTAQQLWKTLAAITAVIWVVAVAAYKAGTVGWP